jgi:hypothetical protein
MAATSILMYLKQQIPPARELDVGRHDCLAKNAASLLNWAVIDQGVGFGARQDVVVIVAGKTAVDVGRKIDVFVEREEKA